MCLREMLFQQEPNAELVGGDGSSLLYRVKVDEG